MKRFFCFEGEQDDVVIIGGGVGGYVAAIKAAQLGLKVCSYPLLSSLLCSIEVFLSFFLFSLFLISS
jgi:predicted oxidoreductase